MSWRRLVRGSMLCLTAGCTIAAPPDPERASNEQETSPFRYNVAMVLGQTWFEKDEFPDVHRQLNYGVSVDVYSPDLPVGLEAELFHSRDGHNLPGGGNFDANVTELALGARKTWEISRWRLRPYLALGSNFLYSEQHLRSPTRRNDTDDDFATGFYTHGGAYFMLTDHLFLGLDLRLVEEDAFDFVSGADLDSRGATLRLGWSF